MKTDNNILSNNRINDLINSIENNTLSVLKDYIEEEYDGELNKIHKSITKKLEPEIKAFKEDYKKLVLKDYDNECELLLQDKEDDYEDIINDLKSEINDLKYEISILNEELYDLKLNSAANHY